MRYYGGKDRWSSKELGWLSIGLSFFSFALLPLVDDLGLELLVIQIAVFLCAMAAAERGSKMWLLLWLEPPLFFMAALVSSD